MANQLKSYRCFHCAIRELKYWNSVSTYGAHLQFKYHSCEEIVFFSRDSSTEFYHNIQNTKVTSGQKVLYRCFDCARLESKYWNSVSTFGAQLRFKFHIWEETVYFSRDLSTAFFHNIQNTEVTLGQQVLYRCFHCARLESKYWNSVSTYGAHLQFKYHSCEEIVYFSRDSSTEFYHSTQNTEVASGHQVLYRCFHCAKLQSKHWNSVYTYGAQLQFQDHSCEEIFFFSRDISTTFIQYIQQTEVMANQQKSYRCFHCARLESKYWNSVYTYGAHLQFQYHSCEEIVYFSWDFSTAFYHNIQNTEVTSGQQVFYRFFDCSRLESIYWNSVATFGAHLLFQYHSCDEIGFFSRDFSSTFIHYIQQTVVTANQLK